MSEDASQVTVICPDVTLAERVRETDKQTQLRAVITDPAG